MSIVLITCAGLGTAVALNSNGASAADVGDLTTCGSDCKDWKYVESSGYIHDGPAEIIGPDGKTCPGAGGGSAPGTGKTTAKVSIAKTIGHDWAWSAGGDITFAFFGGLGGSFFANFESVTSEAVTGGFGFDQTIPVGELGHMEFIPRMYHSEGNMSWTEYMYDEFNTTLDWQQDVVTETPLKLDSGLAAGVYLLNSRLMDATELRSLCPESPQ